MVGRRRFVGAIFVADTEGFMFKLLDPSRSSNFFTLLQHEVGVLGNFSLRIREWIKPIW